MAALSKANLACRCCTNATEALDVLESVLPNLILCDVNLHGESGVEICERIRQRPGMENVQVMFLSGNQLPDIIRRSNSSGGGYCLRKPFDPNVLIELIDQSLGVADAE
jgi:two-component system OmpR family response regulator